MIVRFGGRTFRRLTRAVAWFLVLAITVLSVSPPDYRPVTPAPHDLEHFAIFLATGLAFGLGYQQGKLVQVLGLIVFSAGIELIQLYIPGRHARLSDFVVNATSVTLGCLATLLLGRMARWWSDDSRTHSKPNFHQDRC